jgi:hypothetical protein
VGRHNKLLFTDLYKTECSRSNNTQDNEEEEKKRRKHTKVLVTNLPILHEISKRKGNWIGYILRRNCLLQQVIEGKINGGIEVTGRRG